LLPAFRSSCDESIVIGTEAGVDVVSDNASEISVWPSTTSPQRRKATQLACTQGQREARPVVCDNVDMHGGRLDDRVMQQTNRQTNYQGGEQNTCQVGMADTCVAKRCVTDTTVLVIAGIATGMVSRELTGAGALSIPNGITLNVFDQLAYLPPYSETSEGHRIPRLVTALHTAAFEAHAALVLTDHHEYIPATVRNAIDWLTRRWNHSALQDKPLAVIGPTEDGYSGAWARHHTEESGRFTETLVIEPITVTTLREAVTGLAEQANITRATRAGQRYDPGLMTTLTPDMKPQSDFRADGAAEFDVGRLRRQLAKPEARLKEFERGAEIG
jgi:NAD(P)H-dependent FMN reductase